MVVAALAGALGAAGVLLARERFVLLGGLVAARGRRGRRWCSTGAASTR